ncbi:MAG: hypothetical protein IJG68_06540 [Bacilli bacterium]|nr:hypothetical protein [Bacilli bacterium]
MEDFSSNKPFFLGLSLKVWVLIILICVFLGLVLYQANNKFYSREKKIKQQEELGANISLDYDNNTNVLKLTDFTPTKDYLGKTSGIEKCFDFTVNVHLKQASKIRYELAIKKDPTSTINDQDVRIYLEKKDVAKEQYLSLLDPTFFKANEIPTDVGTPTGYMVLTQQSVNQSQKDYYRLRMWLSEKSTVVTGDYSVEIILNAIAE